MSPLPTILAYLDPGVGAMIFQAAAAGILGALFTIKLWWGKLMGLFGKKSPAHPDFDDVPTQSAVTPNPSSAPAAHPAAPTPVAAATTEDPKL